MFIWLFKIVIIVKLWMPRPGSWGFPPPWCRAYPPCSCWRHNSYQRTLWAESCRTRNHSSGKKLLSVNMLIKWTGKIVIYKKNFYGGEGECLKIKLYPNCICDIVRLRIWLEVLNQDWGRSALALLKPYPGTQPSDLIRGATWGGGSAPL